MLFWSSPTREHREKEVHALSVQETLAGLLLAGIALYGLGLPMAWLAPAPAQSPWAFRIAVAPLYAVATAGAAGIVLGAAGVPLHPGALFAWIALAWAVAAWMTRRHWRVGAALRGSFWPALPTVVAGLLWLLTLVGYGLYLPNRDFKNHAYFVAQVAWTRSAELGQVLRPSPLSDPSSAGFYPLGLHTLLGWILPSPSYPAVAVTAASAVLVTSISMPLAVIVMARLWDRESPALGPIAGLVAVGAIGLTSAFEIGSATVLCAAALFAASLAALWLWVREPSISSTAALAFCGVGLLLLHVAEAVGLALVAVACLPRVWSRWPRGNSAGRALLIGALGAAVVAVALSIWVLRRLLPILEGDFGWDLQPNEEGPVTALALAVLQQPEGDLGIRFVWVGLALGGFWLARRRRLSAYPVLVFTIVVALGTLSGMALAPGWLQTVTAPWYGSASRVAVMAIGPWALAASLSLVVFVTHRPERPLRWGSAVLAISLVVALMSQVTPTRRAALQAALAGAGDTPALAQELRSRMSSEGTVVNLEGDGSANLFAFARVPVLSGWVPDEAVGDAQPGGVPLLGQLAQLSDPGVSRHLRELNVEFIVLGTTSRYWGEQVGYIWQDLARQPELSLELQGTDMVVLRYQERR